MINHFYFPGFTTDNIFDTINIYVIPINDAIPEINETVTLTVTNAYATLLYPFTANGSGTFTILDDDDWTITDSVTDDIALEPCVWIPGEERLGAFELTKSGGLDNSYGIMVEFELGGTASPVADYGLSWYGSGDAETMISIMQVGDVWKGSAYFQAGDDTMNLFVVPHGDHLFENDETVTLTITDAYAVYGYSFNYSSSADENVTIYQAPEFISNADINVDTDSRPFAINGDTYYAYVSRNAEAGKKVNTAKQINAVNNRGVVYSIVSGNEAGLFAIDSESGEITTAVSLKEMANLAVAYSLQIKAKDPDSNQYDLATVPITLTQWQVSRNGASNAPVISMAGCTIAELADEIGLESNEFNNWLTFTSPTVTLIDGTVKSTNVLGVNDILASGQSFQIPNTIYMAWFGEMGTAGQWWMSFGKNQEELGNLGFNIMVFDNDAYPHINFTLSQNQLLTNSAQTEFVSNLNWLSNTKAIHGMYIMGHGSSTSFGSDTPKVWCDGPIWDIGYVNGTNTTSNDAIVNYLDYKLGALIIHACYGDNDDALDLKSTNGIFFGVSNVYTPAPFYDDTDLIAKFWGYKMDIETVLTTTIIIETFGGSQRTNIFTKTTYK